MPKNIEMSVLGSDGTYDVLYPKNISDIVLSSEYLKGVFNLSDNSDIDDAFDYINRKIILLQYNKAGINVTLKTAGGSPLEGIPINGITANYDGTGSCVTDSEGKCFGYCDAGSVTVSCNSYADMTINSQQIQTLATEMYDVELTASNLLNFIKIISSNNIIFSTNVSTVDVCCVGGGGGSFSQRGSSGYIIGGGAGGQVTINEGISVESNTSYSLIVGSGGRGSTNEPDYDTIAIAGNNGGDSSFLNVVGTGGACGWQAYRTSGLEEGQFPAVGNGNGGYFRTDTGGGRVNPTEGNNIGYYSFTETGLYGGGGAGGYSNTNFGYTDGTTYGGRGTTVAQSGFGGGGGYANRNETSYSSGGSGCVAIRMHLKVTF